MRKDDSIYKERRLLHRSLKKLMQVEFYCHWKLKDHKQKNPLKDKAILPPSKNPPKHCLHCCVTKVIVLCKGEKNQKVKRLKTKAGKLRECHPVCWVVAGFCCVSFNRVLLITNMKILVSGFRQIPLR